MILYNVPFEVSAQQYFSIMSKYPGYVAGQDQDCGLEPGRYRLKVLGMSKSLKIEGKLKDIEREMQRLKK